MKYCILTLKNINLQFPSYNFSFMRLIFIGMMKSSFDDVLFRSRHCVVILKQQIRVKWTKCKWLCIQDILFFLKWLLKNSEHNYLIHTHPTPTHTYIYIYIYIYIYMYIYIISIQFIYIYIYRERERKRERERENYI